MKIQHVYLLLALLMATSTFATGTIDTVSHKVFFDIEIDGQSAGRIVFGLFGNTVPPLRVTLLKYR